MTTSTTTLSDWLLAQIAEDEAVAREAQGRRSGHWTQDGASIYDGHPMDEVVDWVYRDAWGHIARHDPARVLAQCEAHRRIVEKAQRAAVAFDHQINPATSAAAMAMDEVLANLAAIYADRDGFREDWRA
jgi:hypothetical protein